jgi:manganese oxidase
MNTRTLTRQMWSVTKRFSLGIAASIALASTAHAAILGLKGKNFELCAKADRISAADGITIYNWGYADCTNGNLLGKMQYPGPTLIVNEGDTVRVKLNNQLPYATSIFFPGQSQVTTTSGNNGFPGRQGTLVAEATGTLVVSASHIVEYTFVAKNPGTYMYHSGTQMDLQIEMGLVGTLIVRPKSSASQAYNHAATAFDREYLMMLTEIDPILHEEVEHQVERSSASIDLSSLPSPLPKYFFVNGRNSPDTLTKANAPEMPNQPYNALARMHPGERMLMRLVNAGRSLHPFHHHGNDSWTVARDGRMLSTSALSGPDLSMGDFTVRTIPGQTVDAIYEWTGQGLGWDIYGVDCIPGANSSKPCPPLQPYQDASDQGKKLPITLPSELELIYGTMYSGSPFLGKSGPKPVGAGSGNTTNAYFHMAHSHNEAEILNDGVFPGGMMTMIVIEPWSVPIND